MTKKIIPASEQIKQIGNGYVDLEIGKALSEATAACLEHGKQAVVTVKFVIQQHNHKDGTVKILGDISSKLPKEKTEGSIVYVTPEGNLSVSDPAQINLNLQSIPQPEVDLKQVENKPTTLRIANAN